MQSLFVKSIAIVLCLMGGNLLRAEEPQRQISVSGESEVRIAPDEIILTLGVETYNIDLKTAKAENDSLVKSALEIASDYEIPEKYLKTDYIEIQPVFESYNHKQNFLHYQVRKTIALTIRKIDSYEPLLTDMLEAGIDHVIGIDFRTTDLRTHKDAARALAVRAAREKAEAMAGELDQILGEVISISEHSSGYYPWYGSSWYGRSGGYMSQNVIQNTGGAGISGAVLAPGQISITAKVGVTFVLK